jgi:hypothetical protein
MADDHKNPGTDAGSHDPEQINLTSEEEPVVSGTLFLTLVFLMLIFGFWVMMYLILLNR